MDATCQEIEKWPLIDADAAVRELIKRKYESPLNSVTERIAFISGGDGDFEIYVMDADNPEVAVQLTDNTTSDLDPALSPDGERIAFSSDRDGDYEIYVMNVDGTGVVEQLTDRGSTDRFPSWSPGGERIAFSSNRSEFLGISTTDDYEIYVINADGTGVVDQLTDNDTFESRPSWSPDGNQITFYSDRNEILGIATTNDYEIYVMDADGSNLRQLTDNDVVVSDTHPSWSPSGDRIAFSSNSDGDFDIWMIDVEDRSLTQLTDNSVSDSYPSWSPDGNRVAFASDSDGDFDIWVIDANGSNLQKMTDNSVYDGQPSWARATGSIYTNPHSHTWADAIAYTCAYTGATGRQLRGHGEWQRCHHRQLEQRLRL